MGPLIGRNLREYFELVVEEVTRTKKPSPALLRRLQRLVAWQGKALQKRHVDSRGRFARSSRVSEPKTREPVEAPMGFTGVVVSVAPNLGSGDLRGRNPTKDDQDG